MLQKERVMSEWDKAGVEGAKDPAENWSHKSAAQLSFFLVSKDVLHVHNLQRTFYLLSILHFTHS